MGGGTDFMRGLTIYQPGLSPRGRGNRRAGELAPTWERSIPAWAGEPGRSTNDAGWMRVYPRVGGGTCLMIDVQGLTNGSIPAWAGEPRGKRSSP